MSENSKPGEMVLYTRGLDKKDRGDKKSEPLTEKEYKTVADFRATGLPELVAIEDRLPGVYVSASEAVGITPEEIKGGRASKEKLLLLEWIDAEESRLRTSGTASDLLLKISSHEEMGTEMSTEHGTYTEVKTRKEVSLEEATREFMELEQAQWKPDSRRKQRKDRTLKRIPKFNTDIANDTTKSKKAKVAGFQEQLTEMLENRKKYIARLDQIKKVAEVNKIVDGSEEGAVDADSATKAEISPKRAVIVAQMRVALLELTLTEHGLPKDERVVMTILSLYDEYNKEVAVEQENKKNHEVTLLKEVEKIKEQQNSMSEYAKLRVPHYAKFWSAEVLAMIMKAMESLMHTVSDAQKDIRDRQKTGNLENLTVEMLCKEYETRKVALLEALDQSFEVYTNMPAYSDGQPLYTSAAARTGMGNENYPEAKNFFLAEYDKLERAFGEHFCGYDETAPVIDYCRKKDGKKPLNADTDKLKAAKALSGFIADNPDVLEFMKGAWSGDTEHMNWRLSLDSADVSLASFVGDGSGEKGYSAKFDSKVKGAPELRVQNMSKLVDLARFSNAETHRPTSGSRERPFSWRLSTVSMDKIVQTVPRSEQYQRPNVVWGTTGSTTLKKASGFLDITQMIQDRIVEYVISGKVSSPSEVFMMKHVRNYNPIVQQHADMLYITLGDEIAIDKKNKVIRLAKESVPVYNDFDSAHVNRINLRRTLARSG